LDIELKLQIKIKSDNVTQYDQLKRIILELFDWWHWRKQSVWIIIGQMCRTL